MRLPDDVFATLQRVCQAYPYAVVQSGAHLGAILVKVAWAHRADGWGLSRKDFGKCVESPVGLIAEDVLHHQPSNLHWDVLSGAGVGQPLRPIQTDAIGIMHDPRRPWVAPVDPGDDPVRLPPPVDVHACRFVPCDQGDLRASLSRVEAQIDALSRDLRSLVRVIVEEHLDDIKRRTDLARGDVQTLTSWLRGRSVLRW